MAPISYLIVGGAVCLIMALIEAWLLIGHFAGETGAVAKIIPGRQDLLRSHIDYLMMAQFQFVFYALYRVLAITPSLWIVAAVCIGSFVNPFGFLVQAFKPAYRAKGPAPFMAMMMASCVLTTVGYAVSAWLFASAALNGAALN